MFVIAVEPAFLLHFMGNRVEEANQRRQFNNDTRQSFVLALQDFFHEHVQWICRFRTALDYGMPTDDSAVVRRPDQALVGSQILIQCTTRCCIRFCFGRPKMARSIVSIG